MFCLKKWDLNPHVCGQTEAQVTVEGRERTGARTVLDRIRAKLLRMELAE